MGLSVDETKQHVDVISHLDPKPGDRYNPAVSQHVIPDVFIVKSPDGYTALVNNEGLPQLRISKGIADFLIEDLKVTLIPELMFEKSFDRLFGFLSRLIRGNILFRKWLTVL